MASELSQAASRIQERAHQLVQEQQAVSDLKQAIANVVVPNPAPVRREWLQAQRERLHVEWQHQKLVQQQQDLKQKALEINEEDDKDDTPPLPLTMDTELYQAVLQAQMDAHHKRVAERQLRLEFLRTPVDDTLEEQIAARQHDLAQPQPQADIPAAAKRVRDALAKRAQLRQALRQN